MNEKLNDYMINVYQIIFRPRKVLSNKINDEKAASMLSFERKFFSVNNFLRSQCMHQLECTCSKEQSN